MEVNGYLQTHEKVSIDSVMDYFGNPEDQASFKDLVKRLYEECIKNRAKERKKEKEMELSARKEQKNKDKRSRDKRKK